MTYYLSAVNFTEQDDIIEPGNPSNPEPLFNGYNDNAYTLGGNDRITGYAMATLSGTPNATGLHNSYYGIINTGIGRDVITGVGYPSDPDQSGIYNLGSIETGDEGDYLYSYGSLDNRGLVSLGDGGDYLYAGVSASIAMTEEALKNSGTLEAGNGDDSLVVIGSFPNYGWVSLGSGNDSINLNAYFNHDLENYQTIETGDGQDIITADSIYNHGVINTGDGNDRISSNAYSFMNIVNPGVINTGNGNDSLSGYFEDSMYLANSGSVLLGDGDDYLNGYGNGYYEGGNGQDFLELPSGQCYTIGIYGGGVSFTKGWDGKVMHTFGFEKLIVGSTTYDFTSFFHEQSICV
jgi:hypothetical protein